MFYSHQLLARKAPMGQIWMAATMHAKINRRKLDKLNIIKICEEILNPSVPMALRLSGILMGGVVIVYERKVKLLYDDVTRLLVEINEAWKVKAVPDRTVLPKGKSQAKKEAVTLPDNNEKDLGDLEQSLNFSSAIPEMEFHQTAYFAMRLDSVDEPYLNDNNRQEDPSQHLHQAEAENITLLERFDMYQSNADHYNRFERFDIEGEEDTQLNFTSAEHTQIPTTLIPSPPHNYEHHRAQQRYSNVSKEPPPADEIPNQRPEDQAIDQHSNGYKDPRQDGKGQDVKKMKTRKLATAFVMDCQQTIIPGHVYQSWLQNASDIVSRRGRKRKHTNIMSTMKISTLMDLPPIVVNGGLFTNGNREIHYPQPLLELWMKSIQPLHDSPSERTSPPLPPQPSSSSYPERVQDQDPMNFHFEDYHSGNRSQSLGVPLEKLRANLVNSGLPTEIIIEGLRDKSTNNSAGMTDRNPLVTPGDSGAGYEIRSMSSASGFHSDNSEANSGRSNKKRLLSSSRHGSGGLEPVAEETSWPLQHPDLNFKLGRLSENGLTPDQELMETGPTQTQQPVINHPVDKITDSIRMQMKAHFETPGAPQVESLNNLATGMSRKGAALLFYQTCVLATREVLRVDQKVPYGEILISRGAKM